ncbi:hypothetical protein DC083_02955 [Ignatzschineria ureiclastica]|uniref:DUF3545 domain-containing protein n=1 Tax=Ignatzschineria ureiclastica TaxID=472582 RepID=A0A2U2AFJ0_9GAMM|nr:hypothetical protein [Ignatzschineria ureiclastica]PWD81422.1 hypothetical protein DC083_02955 [Ignatzschineria ureiclastica]GHA00633.1 hypothetical protein GCM10007162_15950 [Ignatzschineria ureiclastica]
MSNDYDDDLLDDEDIMEEDVPDVTDVKGSKSQAWRSIEAIREERALQKKLAKEFDLDSFDDLILDDEIDKDL